jgi:hypothetical protein
MRLSGSFNSKLDQKIFDTDLLSKALHLNFFHLLPLECGECCGELPFLFCNNRGYDSPTLSDPMENLRSSILDVGRAWGETTNKNQINSQIIASCKFVTN